MNKMVIAKGATKREIEAPFSVCMTRDDMEDLVRQLKRHLADGMWSYGWVEIMEKRPVQGVPNSPPGKWEEGT